MRYAYYDMYDAQFEELAVAIATCLLGLGVQPFSTGPDGGRDARFSGTAEQFPSKQEPLRGKFVIQAKHTEHPFAKFSDSGFSGDKESSVISEEIPRIKALRKLEELDHYLLFSNRRLGGIKDQEIRHRIIVETQVATVELFGVERIDKILKEHPSIADNLDLPSINAPLRISSDDLAEVITAIDKDKSAFQDAVSDISALQRTSFRSKNETNKLPIEFAKHITSRYLSDFERVRVFLSHPANEDILERYEDAAAEFHEQILTHSKDFDTFDRVLVKMQELLFARDSDLARNKRLTKLLIYYMYWNCDIGIE